MVLGHRRHSLTSMSSCVHCFNSSIEFLLIRVADRLGANESKSEEAGEDETVVDSEQGNGVPLLL